MDKIRRNSLVETQQCEMYEPVACPHCFLATQWPANEITRPFIHVTDDYKLRLLQIRINLRLSDMIIDNRRRNSLVEALASDPC